MEAEFANSRAGRVLDRLRRVASRAWPESRARRAAAGIAGEWRALDRVSLVRAVGGVVVIAAATAVALGRFEQPPAAPLEWLIPALCAAAAAAAIAGAEAIVRAIDTASE
jgi:hypothetical protein